MALSASLVDSLEEYTRGKYELRLDKSKITRLFTSMRPAYTEAEEYFVQKYLMCDEMVAKGMYQDGYGNCLFKIPNEDGTPSRTLWSCHTDSVHREGGVQTVHYDPLTDKFSTPDGSCLGADDNSGTYVLLELMRNNVPGLYIFHRAEEVGGVGSAWIAKNSVDMLEQYDRAIAFDRKDVHSIITHQGSKRCCSEAFSADLSAKLGMNHRSDSGGSFTDTANYDHIIPECTNMSVGYFNAHSARETQLLDYLWKLKDAFVRIDCEGLVTERDAKAPVEWSMSGYYGYGDSLIKPHKEARTAMGWSKQDDIKWRQDKKKKKEEEKKAKKEEEGITTEDLVAIIPEDDFGPKSKKSTKYDEDSPDWDDFFMQQTD
tara:strand:+ start:6361 stop:7479 length:1119 start_codon:yes stop_codon:yes gene_type:complete